MVVAAMAVGEGANSSPFDAIRMADDRGEYWMARELMKPLGYDRWENFRDSIERARQACHNSGQGEENHFFVTSRNKPGQTKGRGRPAEDVRLTRYACYLVAMNGDPGKAEIAAAQTYFAIQTVRAEQQLPALPVLAPVPASPAPHDLIAANLQVLRQFLDNLAAVCDQQRELSRQQAELASRVGTVEESAERANRVAKAALDVGNSNYGTLSVLGWARLHNRDLTRDEAAKHGRRLTARCQRLGIDTPKIRDSRFGLVGVYPEKVVDEYFAELDAKPDPARLF